MNSLFNRVNINKLYKTQKIFLFNDIRLKALALV